MAQTGMEIGILGDMPTTGVWGLTGKKIVWLQLEILISDLNGLLGLPPHMLVTVGLWIYDIGQQLLGVTFWPCCQVCVCVCVCAHACSFFRVYKHLLDLSLMFQSCG